MNEITMTALVVTGLLVVALAILRLRHVSLQSLLLGLVGAIFGLVLGALASVPLSKLPAPFGSLLPVVVTVVLTVVLIGVALSRRQSLPAQLGWLHSPNSAPAGPTPTDPNGAPAPAPATPSEPESPQLPPILVDTSVIIDGRIADIAAAGFVPGRLVVPRFVLAELQNIADSEDAMRRGRGRRGLDVLNNLRDLPDVGVEITEEDVSGIREVDAKLVALAQRLGCNVLTTDYNLNRVAQIQGVRVLNVNELSNAIRPVVLPGEELMVRVVQPGKERNQGVGYLADGTMIVVENGDKLIGQEVATEVTRVFQTVAGKMIFATPRKSTGPDRAAQSEIKPKIAPSSSASAVADKPKDYASPRDQHDAKAGKNEHKGRFGRGQHRHNNGTSNGTNNAAPSGANNGNSNGAPSAPNPSTNTNSGPTSAQPRNLEDRVIAAADAQPVVKPLDQPTNNTYVK